MRPRHMRCPWIGACLVVLAAAGWHAPTAVAQDVTYEVRFQGNWTTQSTPGGVVGGAHFTTLIGAVHGSGVTFWESGATASTGVEQVAELGSTGAFRSEVQASPHTLSVIQQGVSGGGTGSATFTITVTQTHPLVTLLSMIGPSPDWFVGVSGLSLLDNADQWPQEHVVDLYPYDAGTEDGTEFTLSNPATSPQGVITSIRGEGKFSSVRMARLTFTRQTPVASFASASQSAGEGSGTRNVTVNLNPAPTSNITVNYSVGGTATNDDFSIAGSGTLSVSSGASTATIPAVISDDNAQENAETVILTLTAGTGYTVGGANRHTLTITDNDAPTATPVASFASASQSAGEGSGTRNVTVNLNPAPTSNITVNYSVGGTATNDDFSIPGSGTLSVPSGASTATIPAVISDDNAQENAETVILTLTAGTGYTVGSTNRHTLTITDNDAPPTNRPPTVSALCDPCAVETGGEVRLAAVASDADGDSLTYVWSAAQGRFVGAANGATARWVAPSQAGRYTVHIEVSDGRGGSAAAEVAIEVLVSNRPPSFGQLSYAFELREGVAGPAALGQVAAEDPDGDPLTYGLAAGDGGRFTVQAGDGAVTYVGVGEDFETEPNRFELTVRARDTSGSEARAQVVVTVTNVNEQATAVDDAAETPEDEAVTVDVLANDVDPDGDRLRVESVSAASHGATRIVPDGGVEYTPEANYHGPDRFTYVVSDEGGETATATVEITVLPVNDAPLASDDEGITEEDQAAVVDVLANDVDPDGDRLRVESVSAASHGATRIAPDGGVEYTPEANYHGPDRFTYVVSDEGGETATATVEITVLPVNDAPLASDDEGITEEDRAAVVDVLANDVDPDGDQLRVESVSAASHGATRIAPDGGVEYTPEANYHGPDRFTYVVSDEGGETATATVEITVLPVNDAPLASDDEGITEEDRAAVVDVLANDVDPDGDQLRVESVSAASHGATRIAPDGGVEYTPEANYHGPDRFTYVVSDEGGETATATVEMTVAPVNDAPEAVGTIPDQTLDEGGNTAEVDLTPYFEDADGDVLTFRAASSNPSVATAAVAGAVLTLTATAYGSAEVTVTAEDPGGLTATQTFTVGVDDRLVRTVLGHTLAAMARSHLASARMTLGRRVTEGAGEESRLTVMGRPVSLAKAAAKAAARQILVGWLYGQAGSYGTTGTSPWLGAHPGGGFGATAFGGVAGGGMLPATAGDLHGFGVGSDALLRGTEFQLMLGGGDAGEALASWRWRLWGQGDIQTFQGAPSVFGSDSRYDGDVRTGYVGVDAQLTERWLAGVAVARSRGVGDWGAGGSSGVLTARLTALHPYAQWSDGTTSVWTMAGSGWGEAENVREATGLRGTSGLGLRLGLIEVRRRLGALGGAEFGVRADAAWAELRTAEGGESVDGLTAAVHQQRVGAEVSQPVRLGGLALRPFGEAHLRRDGGAGQTGTGVEVAGGLRAQIGIVRINAQGRLLAVHSADGYRERGAAVTLTVGRQGREGLSMSISPRWGDAAAGTGVLWQDEVYRRHLPGAARDAWAVNACGGYGMRLPGGGLLTWLGSYSRSADGLGGNFSVGLLLDGKLSSEVAVTRRRTFEQGPDNMLALKFKLNQ